MNEPSQGLSSRREFMARAGKFAVAAGAALGVTRALQSDAEAAAAKPLTARRLTTEYKTRLKVLAYEHRRAVSAQQTNGDEVLYANKIASFSKMLPHNDLGEVDANAYAALLNAINSGKFSDFEAIPLGGVGKLTNPAAAFANNLEGPCSSTLTIAPAPTFASAEQGAEMVELYWYALARDIPFSDYATHPVIGEAAADLSNISEFTGPRDGGAVTTGTLFRGNTPGDLIGPFVSQFLLLDFPFGATLFPQRFSTFAPGLDYMTYYDEWLNIQRGGAAAFLVQRDTTNRYMRNLRDLTANVFTDVPYQEYFVACSILTAFGPAALDPGIPYPSKTQDGFVTGGPPHAFDLVGRVANSDLKAAWYQKWLFHRRVRPEAYSGRVHNKLVKGTDYPIPQDLLDAAVLPAIFNTYDSYLLPQAFPVGSPAHPSYPSGHATTAGACGTMLKAFFNEDFVIPNPVVPNSDGTALLPYGDVTLTVGNEINKLAANIALARDAAGVHYRSDALQGMLLGEQYAIGLLQDYKATFIDPITFTLTKFDGTKITI